MKGCQGPGYRRLRSLRLSDVVRAVRGTSVPQMVSSIASLLELEASFSPSLPGGRRNNSSAWMPGPNHQNLDVAPHWQKEPCRCDWTKDLNTEILLDRLGGPSVTEVLQSGAGRQKVTVGGRREDRSRHRERRPCWLPPRQAWPFHWSFDPPPLFHPAVTAFLSAYRLANLHWDPITSSSTSALSLLFSPNS